MRYAFTLVLLAASLVIGDSARATDDNSALVTIITSAEPQTQLMSLVLTMQAVEQGAPASILLCGPGGDIALQDAPATATAPQAPMGASPQGLLTTLMARGVTVEVCALFLPNKGADASILIGGVGEASPPEMTRRLTADDAVVLSF